MRHLVVPQSHSNDAKQWKNTQYFQTLTPGVYLHVLFSCAMRDCCRHFRRVCLQASLTVKTLFFPHKSVFLQVVFFCDADRRMGVVDI